ncbi:MAG: hypothetical protein ACM3XS_10725 [Bacteroidota bacterium]
MAPIRPDAVYLTDLGIADESLTLSFPGGGGLPNLLWETGRAETLPSDWSSYAAFEFQAANEMERTIYLHWRFYDHDRYAREGSPGKEDCYTIMVGILPGIAATVALPIAALHGEARYPLRPPGTGVVYTWGRPVDPRRVTAVRLLVQALETPFQVTLTGPRLVSGPLRARPPRGGPVVDRFGQWNRKDWPGKVHGDEELVRRMQAEDRELAGAVRPPGRSAYGGYTAIRFSPSGFFRLEQEEGGRWWLVDPEGGAFFSTGIDCVRPWSEGPVSEECLPLFEEPPEFLPGGGRQASPYTANLKRAYGESWHERWAERTIRRHLAWGFNTIGNWSDRYLTGLGRLPYVLPLAPPEADPVWRGFPDVCAPGFPAACAAFAAQAESCRVDPMLIGYFLGNEPAWSREAILAERILAGRPSHTRAEILRLLASANGDSLAELNARWGTAFASWDEIGRRPWPDGSVPGPALAALREISGSLVERYYAGLIDALRRADPHHLILGIRFAGMPKEDYLLRGLERSDVVSLNVYAHEPPDLGRLHGATGRPILIGEFHFGALGYGAIAHGLCGVATDRDKGIAFRYFVERLAAMPFVVGAHWFQYIDEPCFGRFDGENYACGFVDVTDRPYPELVAAARATHEGLLGVLTGRRAPTEERPVPAKTGINFD